LNFDIQNIGSFKIGGIEVWITETQLSTWIIMGLLITFALVIRVKLNKFKDVPGGLQNIAEMLVETFDKFVKDSAGDKLMFLGNWYFMVFAFVLLSNISGLFFLRPPTADWTMTFGLALVSFILIQSMGIRFRKKQFFKDLISPNFIFLPLNIIGEFARPISLSFRLFGNILSGTILLSMIYSLAPVFLRVLFPAALHFYFDLFAGVLQAYVFTVLSLSFIGVSAAVSD
jgi:F-type H+-transporting ATPase subunit a